MSKLKNSIESVIFQFLIDPLFLTMGLNLLEYSIIEDDTVPVACINFKNKIVLVNPESIVIKKLGVLPGLSLVLSHESLHDIMEYEPRGEAKDPDVWNISCDFVVHCLLNAIVKESTIKFDITQVSEHSCYDPQFDNMLEEEVYDFLMKKAKISKKKIKMQISSGDKPGDKNSKNDTMEVDATEMEIDLGNGKKFKKTIIYMPKGNEGKNNKGESIETAEEKEKAQNKKAIVKQMLQNSLMKGIESESVRKFLEKLFNIKIDFTKILADSLHTVFEKSIEMVWSTPRLTWLANPSMPYLPNEDIEEKYGTVVFTIDESGSMGDDDLRKAISIVQQSKAYYKNIYVIKHDSHVGWTKLYEEITDTDIAELLERRHCGGTSHRDVFEKINEFSKTNEGFISVCLLVTDMCSDLEETQSILNPAIPRIYIRNAKHEVTGITGRIIDICALV